MDSLGVVPDQIVHELSVESLAIKQEPLVVVQELFLESAVEPLHMSIHLGSSWIGVVVSDLEFKKLGYKVFLELRAIIGKDEGHRIRK